MTKAWSDTAGAHGVQFYETERVLHRAIERFVTPGLTRGEPVAMITRRRTFDAVADRLVSGRDARPILFLEVEAALSDVMDGRMPDAARVDRAFSHLVGELQRGGSPHRIWVYGEMADLLCKEGLHSSAVRLEELWNRASTGSRLSVLCGYASKHFADGATEGYVGDICGQHTHVFPATAAAAVYVVDDDASVRQSLERLLLAADFSVRTFPSAEAFLAGVDRTSAGCLIVDVQLIGMSGTELQARMAQAHWDMPVIMISASHDPRVEEAALRLGALAFLRKPFDAEALLSAIARALP